MLAAAALVPVSVTLYFTFSRGAIWALPIGIVLYAILAQPRGLVTALAAVIPTVVAVKSAYDADLLAQRRLQRVRRGDGAGPPRRAWS